MAHTRASPHPGVLMVLVFRLDSESISGGIAVVMPLPAITR